MGRSRKNYDHLVDFDGNYAIDIKQGIYPGSGLTPGVKGKKGEQGNKGDKGFGDKGQKGAPGTNGLKGQKGAVGPAGNKGQKGDTSQLFTFKGSQIDLINLPSDPEMGDIWFVLNEDNAYFWDGADWVQIPNINQITGDKGDQGEVGDKGEPGLNGLDGPGGQDGDKGDKGEPGVDFDAGDYYDQDAINQLLEFLQSPEFSFDIEYYQDDSSKIENETVDFLSQDAQGPLYNPGMVVVNPSCTVLNSPLQNNSRTLVINYVVDNPGQLRGNGYGMVQHVYNADVGTTDGDAWYRKVRPAQGQFGAWRKLHFDFENYQDLIDYEIGVESSFVPNASKIVLADTQGKHSEVQVEGRGGISIYNTENRLIVDGSPLSGQLTLLGTISVNDDVVDRLGGTTPEPGYYFIFQDSGVDFNTGETVANGDWLIYGADPQQWRWLDMSVSYGVAEVRTKEEKSYLTKTGATQFPELSLDTIEFNQDYPTMKTVAGSTTYNHVANLNDVNFGLNGMTNTLIYNQQVPIGSNLLGHGTYSVDLGNNQINFSLFDALGNSADAWFGTTANDPEAKHRLIDPDGDWEVTGLVSSAGSGNSQYSITYTNGHPALAASYHNDFRIVYFTEYDLQDGDTLVYSSTAEKWIPEQPLTPAAMVQFLEMSNPVGAVTQWFGQTVPDGWLRCDGTTFEITEYPKLHQHLQANYHNYVIGETPDLRDYFLRSANDSDMEAVTYGKKFEYKTGQPYNFGATTLGAGGHGHGGSTDSQGQHWHSLDLFAGRGAGSSTGQNILRPPTSEAGNGGPVTYFTGSVPDHVHTISTEYESNHTHTVNVTGWDNESSPKYVECSFIIRADYNIV